MAENADSTSHTIYSIYSSSEDTKKQSKGVLFGCFRLSAQKRMPENKEVMKSNEKLKNI